MFQLTQIKDAHAKVKSGADFPTYIQDLIQLGVISYDTFVTDGHTLYTGTDNFNVQSEPKYTQLLIAQTCNAEKFKQYLQMHQQGQTDYPTFCNHAAETGVEKWTVDMAAMTCTYYDRSNNKMLEEKIPAP
jgi:uncharacterized protein YbcV (DUF1398 family)